MNNVQLAFLWLFMISVTIIIAYLFFRVRDLQAQNDNMKREIGRMLSNCRYKHSIFINKD